MTTNLILISLVLCSSYICSFIDIEKIEINKRRTDLNRYSCFIRTTYLIDQVSCERNCNLTKMKNGYELLGDTLQMMNLSVVYGNVTMLLPVSLNCGIGVMSSDTIVADVTTECSDNSILVRWNPSNKHGSIILYMNKNGSFHSIVKKSDIEYQIKDLSENTEYQICVTLLDVNGQSGAYKCVKANTTSGTCREPPRISNLKVQITANNLVMVRWKIRNYRMCFISKLTIRLYRKESSVCYKMLVISKEFSSKIGQNMCKKFEAIKLDDLNSGKIFLHWSHSSVNIRINVIGENASFNQTYSTETNDLSIIGNSLIFDGDKEVKGTCYADCITADNRYKGIRSATQYGEICTKWSDSYAYKDFKGKSNWCLPSPEFTWCPYKNLGMRLCDIPHCRVYIRNATNCPSKVTVSTEKRSISGKWLAQNSKIINSSIGHMVLLHNEFGDCIQYTLFGPRKKELGLHVRNFLISCTSGHYSSIITYQYNFSRLQYDTLYQVYLMSIDTTNEVGKILTFSQKTEKSGLPDTPKNILIEATNFSSVNISWLSQAPLHEIVLTSNNTEISTINTTKITTIFTQLDECKQYCVIIKAFNKIGASKPSIKMCNATFTRSIQQITINRALTGLRKTRIISWQSLADNCMKSFSVLLWVDGSKKCLKVYNTTQTRIKVRDLQLYTRYKVRVDVVYMYSTQQGEKRRSSNILSFYTGNQIDKPIFSYFKVQFVARNFVSIKWIIDNLSRHQIAALIIKLSKNVESSCSVLLNIQNDDKSSQKCSNKYTIEKNPCHGILKNTTLTDVTEWKLFQYWSKASIYAQITVVSDDGITYEAPSVSTATIDDDSKSCFMDCYVHGYYNGIRSADKNGEVCSDWVDSVKYKDQRKSNMCAMKSKCSKPWCSQYDNTSYEYCDVPHCDQIISNIGTKKSCVDIVSVASTNSSLSGVWKPQLGVQGFIVLLHDKDAACMAYILYGKLEVPNLGIHVTNFIPNCEKNATKPTYDSALQYEFTDLQDNTSYSLYIIPIIDKNNTGFVRVISQSTKMFRPAVLENVKVSSYSTGALFVSWNVSGNSSEFGAAEHFIVNVYKDNKIEYSTNKIRNSSYLLNNLKPCREYCVTVFGVNAGGSSDDSEVVCGQEFGPNHSSVELNEIKNGLSKERIISWKFLGDDCSRSYNVSIWVQTGGDKCLETYETNETQYKVSDLQLYMPYKVQVKVTSKSRDLEVAIQNSSDVRSFYTGTIEDLANLVVFNRIQVRKKDHFKLFYRLDPRLSQLVFEYDIIIVKADLLKCYRRFRIKKNCIYNECNEGQFMKLPEKKNHLFKHKNCPTNYTDIECRNNTISILFTSTINIEDISIQMFGRTYVGWQTVTTNVSVLKLKMGYVFITLIVAPFLLVFLIILLTVIFIKRRCSVKTYQLNNSDIDEVSIDSIEMVEYRAFTDVSRPISHITPVSEFNQTMLQYSTNTKSPLIAEYKALKQETKSLISQLGLTTIKGSSELVSNKNRFSNILPYDQTRIKLENKGFPQNYINANEIPFVGNTDQIEYLASQAPTQECIEDFLRMIWEQNINCVVMLTQTEEGDKSKCLQYWPNEVDCVTEFSGNLQIKLQSIERNEVFIERNLSIINNELENERSILQMQMHTWFDYSAPDLEYFDKFLMRFQQLMKQEARVPYLIHCSAGVGRTGTFIALDRLTRNIMDGCNNIDVYDTVLNLRRYRNLMVQRQAQYIFIHEYLDHFIKKYRENRDTQ